MKRRIFCYFLNRKAEGFSNPPFPGKIGERIYREISILAWKEWQSQQTMLINEKKLNMLLLEDRKFLEKNMVDFLFKKKRIKISNYTPIKNG